LLDALLPVKKYNMPSADRRGVKESDVYERNGMGYKSERRH